MTLAAAGASQPQLELETIFQHASIGIAFTCNKVVTRCNPAFEAMFGYASGQLMGQPGSKIFISEANYRQFAEQVAPALSLGQSIDLLWQFKHQDGHLLTCKIRGQAVNPSPSDEGTVWLLEDITLATQQSSERQRTALEFQAIMNNAPVGIIFTVDRKLTRGNAHFCQMFGYTTESLVGLPGRALFPSEEAYQEIGRIAAPKLSIGETISHEMLMARQDGSTFWAQLVAYVVNPRDPSQGTIWLLSDRSVPKAQEESMRQALFESRAILDSAVVGIVYLKNRRVLRCNPHAERILGYAPGTMLGDSSRSWYVDESAFQWVADEVYPAIIEGQTHVRQQQMRRQNGEYFWCRIAGRVHDVDNPIEGGSIWVLEDTTERRAAEEALIGATALMQGVFNSANVSIITTHTNGVIRLMNATAEKWLGYPAEAMIDKETPALIHDPLEIVAYAEQLSVELGEPISPGFDAFVAKARRFGADEHEWSYIRQDGTRFPVHLSVSALRDYNGEITGYIGVGVDITDRKRVDATIRNAHAELEERVRSRTAELAETNQRLQQEIVERQQVEATMRRMAHYDSLTGLPNRNLFHDRMNQALALARRSQKQVGLLFIDLDRFKTINDSLGHDVGDLLLGQVAVRMSYVLRDTDTLARLGGDEFVLLVAEQESPEHIAIIAEKLLEVLSQPIPIQNHALHITPSIGICCFPEDGEDTDTLMRNADTAMYYAKASGRNNYKFFARNMNVEADERFQIESALRYAISKDELRVHYQPLIDGNDGKIWGVEALLRWNSALLGSVSPAKFIPVAEDSGTIVPIGAWVLKDACQQVKKWHDQGHPELMLAVNLSPLQFRQKDLLPMISRVLAETGFPPARLELEITESSLMNNVEEVIAILHKLVTFGVKLAIDDFGTGYSSLAYLKHFPVHKLKIDQSFVRDLDRDEHSAGIVRTIIALATSLKLAVLAEGVETEVQHQQLHGLGCRYLQGYLFSRPVPAAEIPEKLASLGCA